MHCGHSSATATLGILGYDSEIFAFLVNMLNEPTDAGETQRLRGQMACLAHGALDPMVGRPSVDESSHERRHVGVPGADAGTRSRAVSERCSETPSCAVSLCSVREERFDEAVHSL